MLSFILHRGFLLFRRKSVQRFVERVQHRHHAALQSHGLGDGDSGCRPTRDRGSGDNTKYSHPYEICFSDVYTQTKLGPDLGIT